MNAEFLALHFFLCCILTGMQFTSFGLGVGVGVTFVGFGVGGSGVGVVGSIDVGNSGDCSSGGSCGNVGVEGCSKVGGGVASSQVDA